MNTAGNTVSEIAPQRLAFLVVHLKRTVRSLSGSPVNSQVS